VGAGGLQEHEKPKRLVACLKSSTMAKPPHPALKESSDLHLTSSSLSIPFLLFPLKQRSVHNNTPPQASTGLYSTIPRPSTLVGITTISRPSSLRSPLPNNSHSSHSSSAPTVRHRASCRPGRI